MINLYEVKIKYPFKISLNFKPEKKDMYFNYLKFLSEF